MCIALLYIDEMCFKKDRSADKMIPKSLIKETDSNS